MAEQQATPAVPPAMPDPAAIFQLVSVPPPWLTKEFFQTALQQYEKDKALEITAFDIVPATKPGENFASIVFRATVSYKSRGSEKLSVKFIVKVEPFVEGFQKQMMGCGDQFETESAMYSKTLPAMQHLLKSIGDPEIIAPELIYFSLEPKIIILQDISPDQYVMEKAAVNLDTTTKVLQKLAKFHALSYFMANDQNDETVPNYTEGFMSEKMQGNVMFVNQMLAMGIEVLKGWGKEMEQVAERLTTLAPVLFPKMIKVYKANPAGSGYNVLNHGDFHLRNLMFKWQEGPEKISESIRFIDFQFCFYGSPAADLLWTLYFVGNHETRAGHREELINLYHQAFVGTLNKLGFLKTPPSLLDLNIELLKNGGLEAFAVLGPLPVFFVDMQELMAAQAASGGPPTLEGMMMVAKVLLEEPVIKDVIMKLLPKLMYLGCLDA